MRSESDAWAYLIGPLAVGLAASLLPPLRVASAVRTQLTYTLNNRGHGIHRYLVSENTCYRSADKHIDIITLSLSQITPMPVPIYIVGI